MKWLHFRWPVPKRGLKFTSICRNSDIVRRISHASDERCPLRPSPFLNY